MQANPLLATLLMSSRQCDFGDTPSVRWISEQSQMDTVMHHMQQKVQQKVQNDRVDSAGAVPATLNYKTQAAVLVSMGQQRTGGYAIGIPKHALQLVGRTAILTVDWQTPKPGMLQTQALTSPCAIIQVPLDNYDDLRVETQQGKPIGSVSIKP